MEEFKVVVFQVGQEEYAIDIQDVISIERLQPVTALPKAPKYVTGIINVRDVVTPVVDLRIALQKEATLDSEQNRMIIVRTKEGHPISLIVDAATDVIDITNAEIQQPNIIGVEDHSFLRGITKLSDRLLIILNIQYLLKDLNIFEKLDGLQIA